jgi:2-polyprenyl-3-methyl-5-hydroxy-6-metoxy-1,4-benzoquinol methylase
MVAPFAMEWMGLDARARQSCGVSNPAIYAMVSRVLHERAVNGTLVDVGCGQGNLLSFVTDLCLDYIGVDAVRYDGFPATARFKQANLDENDAALLDGVADVVVAVETIEHLENPRAFIRGLVRFAKPGGWVLVTTPNQLSLLSLLTLIFKHRFSHFQDVHYPAHLTALLDIDLVRIGLESGLTNLSTTYSNDGRMVLTSWHYPHWLSKLFPRSLSDNIMLIGQKPRR